MWSEICCHENIFFQYYGKEKNIIRILKDSKRQEIDCKEVKHKTLDLFNLKNKDIKRIHDFSVKEFKMKKCNKVFFDLNGNVYTKINDMISFSGKLENMEPLLFEIKQEIYNEVRTEDITVSVCNLYIKISTKNYFYIQLSTCICEDNPFLALNKEGVVTLCTIKKSFFENVIRKMEADSYLKFRKEKEKRYIRVIRSDLLVGPRVPYKTRGATSMLWLQTYKKNKDFEFEASANQLKKYMNSAQYKNCDIIKIQDTGRYIIINETLSITKRKNFFSFKPMLDDDDDYKKA